MITFCLISSYTRGLVLIDSKFFVIDTCPAYQWMVGELIDVVLHLLASNQQFIDIEIIGE